MLKGEFIEETITKFTMMMESGLYIANPQLVGCWTLQGGLTIQKECKTRGTMTEFWIPDQIQFPKKELAPECDNLVIGSSITDKVEIDKSIPSSRQK